MFDGLTDILGYAASSLDKAGPRPMRGLLAGRPRELASIVPFSDELGLTDPKEIASGRDVTDRFGWTRKGAGDASSHAMGLLADALIDPTAILGVGALGRGAVKGLSRSMAPSTMNPVHHLASLLGDSGAATRAASDMVGTADRMKWLRENRRGSLRTDFLSATGDESTPLGRMAALGETADIPIFPHSHAPAETSIAFPYHLEDVLDSDPAFEKAMRQRFFYTSKPAHALWAARPGQVIPNALSYPDIWFTDEGMANFARDAFQGNKKRNIPKRWMSTGSPMHLPVHELGHGLHDRAVGGQGLADFDLWGSWKTHQRPEKPNIYNVLSRYADASPAETVAESFARMADEMARGRVFQQGEAVHPAIRELYRKLMGPEVPEAFRAKLGDYLERLG